MGISLVAAMGAYATLHGFVCITKYRYYLYRDFDLAIFAQAVDGLLRGSLFSSIRGTNWLGDHSSFVLFLVAPLYAVARHPVTLLLIQTLALALGAHPVFLLARAALGREGLALGCAALYLVHPAVGYSNLFEFHPETLATAPLLYAFYFVWAGRNAPALACSGLALLAKEDVAFAVLPLALYALLLRRPRAGRLAGGLAGLALTSLIVTFGVVRPLLAGGEAEYGRMYEAWGHGPRDVAFAIIRHPLRAVGSLVATPGDAADTLIKRQFWVHLLLPVLGLPLLSPLTLALALPVLFVHFLSYRVQQHTIAYQYTATLIPFLIASTVLGLERFTRKRAAPAGAGPDPAPRRPAAARAALTLALVAGLASQALFGPFTQFHWMQAHTASQRVWPGAEDRAWRPQRDRMVARARGAQRLVAGFEFVSRFTDRAEVHSFHHVYGGTYTFSRKPYPLPSDVEAMIGHFGDQSDDAAIPRMRTLLAENRLRPVDAAGDLVLFLRDASDTLSLLAPIAPEKSPLRVVFEGQLAFCGASITPPSLAAGGLLEVATDWELQARADRQFLTELMLYDRAGKRALDHIRYLGYSVWPVTAWAQGMRMRDVYRLLLPADLASGNYAVVMRVNWRRGAESGHAVPEDPMLQAAGSLLQLGAIRVGPRGAG